MIELRNLTIGYKSKEHRKIVASDINATLYSGCLTCLIGSNGVGKSTLLRTLSAFQPPLGGYIYIKGGNLPDNGRDIRDFSDKQLARLIGVVLTGKPDVQNMTVSELVGLGRSPYTGFWGRLNNEDRRIVDESIGMVGISHLSGRLIQTLSDGERQKMMIAKALAQQTPVIYLDEPTAFLDYPSKVEMLQLLHRLSRETDKTIFLSTHDLELALQTADTLWLMDKERGLCVGTPKELALNGSLGRFINRRGILFNPETMMIKITN